MVFKEITEPEKLLNEDGTLAAPGYCKHNYYIYNKEDIAVSKWRVKEWNFYQISNGEWMIQLNFFNISLASAVSAMALNLQTGETITDTGLQILTPGKNELDMNAEEPSLFKYKQNGREVKYSVRKEGRRLYYKGNASGNAFVIDLFLKRGENDESITTATPFEDKRCFFLTQKMNCMTVHGTVLIGERIIRFSRKNTFAVLDWGRGVWPYQSQWYWANGSTFVDGKLFGFEFTWGFGKDAEELASAVFYDGKCNKLAAASIEHDPENTGWMDSWHIRTADGRFDMTMKPVYDHNTGMFALGLLGMKAHQVHGLWSGYAILDDGTRIEVKDMYAFCEKVKNKW